MSLLKVANAPAGCCVAPRVGVGVAVGDATGVAVGEGTGVDVAALTGVGVAVIVAKGVGLDDEPVQAVAKNNRPIAKTSGGHKTALIPVLLIQLVLLNPYRALTSPANCEETCVSNGLCYTPLHSD